MPSMYLGFSTASISISRSGSPGSPLSLTCSIGQRAEQNNVFDDAPKPLVGRSHGEMKVLRRRVRLPALDQADCTQLDRQLPLLEVGANSSDSKALGGVTRRGIYGT